MTGLADLLASRATFTLAALAVSWIAVVLLALIAANLHFRLAHLERSQPSAEASRTPFGHLLGRSLTEALGPGVASGTRLAVVLSSDCASCEQVLERLRRSGGEVPLALVWRDGAPSPLPALPAGAAIVEDGAAVARALGVRVTPFALVADAGGFIVRAAPVGSAGSLDAVLADAGYGEAGRPASTLTHSTPLTRQPLKGISS